MITRSFRTTASWPELQRRYRSVIAAEFANEPEPRVYLSVAPGGGAEVRCPRAYASRVVRALEAAFNRSEVAA